MKLTEIALVIAGIEPTTCTFADWAAWAPAGASAQAASTARTDTRLGMSVATRDLPRTCDDMSKDVHRYQGQCWDVDTDLAKARPAAISTEEFPSNDADTVPLHRPGPH